jgi:hypothetical protein
VVLRFNSMKGVKGEPTRFTSICTTHHSSYTSDLSRTECQEAALSDVHSPLLLRTVSASGCARSLTRGPARRAFSDGRLLQYSYSLLYSMTDHPRPTIITDRSRVGSHIHIANTDLTDEQLTCRPFVLPNEWCCRLAVTVTTQLHDEQ